MGEIHIRDTRHQPGGRRRGHMAGLRANAFTLLELLTVLAVLIVIGSLLLPAVARWREEGRRTNCRRSLTGVYQGISAYGEDGDRWLPVGTMHAVTIAAAADAVADTPGAHTAWQLLVGDTGYVAPCDAIGCPSMDLDWRRWGYAGMSWADYGYRFNTPVTAETADPRHWADAAGVALVGDAACFRGGALAPYATSYQPCPDTCRKWAHLEGGHLVAADGHAAWYANRHSGPGCRRQWPCGGTFSCFQYLDQVMAGCSP